MHIIEFEKLLNDYLDVKSFSQDYNYHGLQVAGSHNISKVAFAVSPTQAIIEKAVEASCDALVTHHGLYWKKQQAVATGLLGKRLSVLMQNQLNLLSYHLPLDCHHSVGNNAQLAKVLEIEGARSVESISPNGILYQGHYPHDKEKFFNKIKDTHPDSAHIYDFSAKERDLKVLWCSGAGGDFIEKAHCDVFITGEISERHYTMAKELGMTLVQAGHWASEVWGPKALCSWTHDNSSLETLFINEFNPI